MAKKLISDLSKCFMNNGNARHVDYVRAKMLLDTFNKEAITDFLDFLLKEGYCDTDVYCEPPTAIDRYYIQLSKQKNGNSTKQ